MNDNLNHQQDTVTDTILQLQKEVEKYRMRSIKRGLILDRILELIDSGKGAVKPYDTFNRIYRLIKEGQDE